MCAELKERETAEADYDRAKQEGKQAACLPGSRPTSSSEGGGHSTLPGGDDGEPLCATGADRGDGLVAGDSVDHCAALRVQRRGRLALRPRPTADKMRRQSHGTAKSSKERHVV